MDLWHGLDILYKVNKVPCGNKKITAWKNT